jgi:hypothetical protein
MRAPEPARLAGGLISYGATFTDELESGHLSAQIRRWYLGQVLLDQDIRRRLLVAK